MTMNMVRQLTERIHPADIIDISPQLRNMRLIKDAYEIQRIRQSAAIAAVGIEAAIKALDQDAAEAQACTQGQYAMRKFWQQEYPKEEIAGFGSPGSPMLDGLNVWCMSNSHIAYGCDCPRDYLPRKGDVVLPMAWARLDGYAAEIERTVLVGKANQTKHRLYDAVLAAREAVFSVIQPGISFEFLYETAIKEMEKAGFGHILPGRCGHGIGLSAHEYPSLAAGNKRLLQPGMIFTVEPGLMTRELGGVRHSDTVLVTTLGYEVLTDFRSDKIVIKSD